MPRSDITGFVLAGGRSQRMGKDKAQLDWEGRSLLVHAVGQAKQISQQVFVVGRLDVEDPAAPVVPDIFRRAGPLGGIHAALSRTSTEWNLILAVDLPLVTVGLLELVASHCDGTSNLAVVPRVGGRLHPLCGAYRRVLLSDIEQALAAGERSIHRLLERLDAGIMGQNSSKMRVIEERELESAGFSAQTLFNVNTPEDLKRAREIAKTLHV
jgi:molybdopterin-guanine dinucleotide biosynthesis protein A